jgi:hypothetical protein
VAGGSANALTLTPTPIITAYANGQDFWFVTGASPNTGSATVNVSSVGAVTIKKNGADLVAGDLAASTVYCIKRYNSLFHLFSPVPSLAGYALLAGAAFTGDVSVAGNFTASSTDAGAGAAPLMKLDRNSASPAASDVLGQIQFLGRNSSAASKQYGSIAAQILDPVAGSEDSQILIQPMVAGSIADSMRVGPGVQIGAPTGGDQGAGTLNIDTTLYKDGVQFGNNTIQETLDVVTGETGLATNTIPGDNTTPLSTEGAQLFSRSFTPKLSTSKIKFSGVVSIAANGASVGTVIALFSGTTCIYVMPADNVSSANDQIVYDWEETAGSTSARTYSLRYGSASGTTNINGDGGSGGNYGGKVTSTFHIRECFP